MNITITGARLKNVPHMGRYGRNIYADIQLEHMYAVHHTQSITKQHILTIYV